MPQKNFQLDGQGKARREAARRRNSELSKFLSWQWQYAYCAAVIGWQRGAATNVTRCRPITAAHGVLPLLLEEFGLLKLILHAKLRRRAASRRALPCPSS